MTELPTPPLGIAVLAPERGVVRPNRAARFVASGLILATVAVAVLVAWQSWWSFRLVEDVLSGRPTVTAGDVAEAEERATLLAWAWLAGLALAWVAFVVWLWRARVNAGRMCDAPHRLRVRWAVVGWLVPVANLWWPQMVVGDVHRASRPTTPARGADLTRLRGSALVAVWWTALLAAQAVDLVAVFFLARDQTVAGFERVFFANAVSAGLAAVAAVAALALMRRVDRWQTGRPAIR